MDIKKNIYLFIFNILILSFSLYISIDSNNFMFLIYMILFSISTLIFLIILTKYYIFNKKSFFRYAPLLNNNYLYSLFKCILLILIILNIIFIIIIWNKLITKLVNILVNYTLNIKNLNIKDYLRNKLIKDSNQPPKRPNDAFSFFADTDAKDRVKKKIKSTKI